MKNFKTTFIASFVLVVYALLAGASSDSSSSYDNDDNYWNSVAREKQLRDAGMDGAANAERNDRLNYMRGNGYSSPDGGKQVHYNGSTEQQRDLNAIDNYQREHPDF